MTDDIHAGMEEGELVNWRVVMDRLGMEVLSFEAVCDNRKSVGKG